jgi:hypothetical protein
MQETDRKWTIFNGYNDKGPFFILITDFDWYEENKLLIEDWFDKNFPFCKPDKNDTIITFQHKHALTLWSLTWS